MDRNEAKRVIEALLFATDTPIAPSKLKSLLGELDQKILRQLMTELKVEYERDGHSFSLVEVAGGFQIYTRPEYAKWVQELFRGKRASRLTAAALETLAIIAYKQPIIRGDIEAIRGVNVDGVMSTLAERNLVAVVGRDERPGKPILYGTTPEFLRYFGLATLSDLPKIEELEEYLKEKEEEREKIDQEIDAELRKDQIPNHGVQEEVAFDKTEGGQEPVPDEPIQQDTIPGPADPVE
ncbi:MAG: SMC-Scp complex subunit ScpB [Candidatus Edwardsbacteria bacterium RIFOXYD12_FULL_50_11]|jgi:segregation and condensation protein B|nr:MAG: SMC-Scp complex subunit ScpB [Candidatus Edwardsbacteria bacterium RifOxyC12_full_54_24]OGF06574.1 MAG: SMC-Scp complex subunit ScpB [Candidatus Edwardsbacteria bacterium RifOxyA12_full_54_48]OGF11723.1 MAG: SMC-Scp complex subunit ScpB [Candidatus Edwardsbacteria bacterium GWE2_54_12]OGF17892.1 MAG: SMC-Scp complex subunit ScpB [Candidatus Edwardsbacteria bacterium RIFOXYD12_FULL_50_11]OGJ18488.1 MAG: SMC-Scp complex subunit ScpB [Candidatus Edwardsbacteria bacterium RifOxyB12_full_52_